MKPSALGRFPRPDRPALVAVAGLTFIGLLALAAAAVPMGRAGIGYLVRQGAAVAAGIVVLFAVAAVPPRRILRWTPVIYVGALALLVGVLFLGTEVRGTRAWFDLGLVRFQPSEAAKVAVILALARLLGADGARRSPYLALAAAVVVAGVPAALILKEPDLGSAATLAGLLLAMPYAAGLPAAPLLFALAAGGAFVGRLVAGLAVRRLAVLPLDSSAAIVLTDSRACVLVVAAALVGCAFATARWGPRKTLPIVAAVAAVSAGALASFPLEAKLKEYQVLRLLTFISPQADPRGASYNVIQSLIAVGSGGLAGKGVTGATQTALGFLPERQTDFIFSVVGEAFGFVGGVAVLGLYALLISRLLGVAARAEEAATALIPTGVAVLLAVHLVVNVGMAMGIVPVMGIPLPLVSYGGSAAVSAAAALGVAFGVDPFARPAAEARRPRTRRVGVGIELE